MNYWWIPIVSFILSIAGSAVGIAFASGRFTEKLDNTKETLETHTQSDERRFTEVSNMLTEMRQDIKELLKRGK